MQTFLVWLSGQLDDESLRVYALALVRSIVMSRYMKAQTIEQRKAVKDHALAYVKQVEKFVEEL